MRAPWRGCRTSAGSIPASRRSRGPDHRRHLFPRRATHPRVFCRSGRVVLPGGAVPGDPRGALVSFVAFGVGIWMSVVTPGRHVPATGNLLLLHAVGFQGLQAVPMLTLLLGRAVISTSLVSRRVRLVWPLWLGACLALAWQSGMGRPVVELSFATAIAVACLLAWFLFTAVAAREWLVSDNGHSQQSTQVRGIPPYRVARLSASNRPAIRSRPLSRLSREVRDVARVIVFHRQRHGTTGVGRARVRARLAMAERVHRGCRAARGGRGGATSS